MGTVIQLGTDGGDPAGQLRRKWGDNIKRVRELRDLSRSQLAEVVEVSEAAVGMWERGETSPRNHVQVAIAKALDVPHAVLFPMEAVA